MTLDAIRSTDSQGMYALIKTFADQWRQGRSIASEVRPDFSVADKSHVVVAGMGGSAIGGDLLRALAARTAAVPVAVVRGYTLPAYVGEASVVIISSYSGYTEETLAAMDEALGRGATVACIASGGEVEARAERLGLTCIRIPGGMAPRAALGYSLTSLLTLAERIELIRIDESEWMETEEILESQSAELSDAAGNRALDLAHQLRPLVPLVFSDSGLMEPVNLRWRGQMQENGKKPAFGNVFPELNHNEIMGWQYPGEVLRGFGVVVLRDREDHPRVSARMDVTRALVSDRAGYWIDVPSQGQSRLARMMSTVNLGDWVSLYLALVRDVDPTPIGLIQELKDALARV
jgi:glucose/mannose-6-phosphate isomerase